MSALCSSHGVGVDGGGELVGMGWGSGNVAWVFLDPEGFFFLDLPICVGLFCITLFHSIRTTPLASEHMFPLLSR